jgi:hypothetical protein
VRPGSRVTYVGTGFPSERGTRIGVSVRLKRYAGRGGQIGFARIQGRGAYIPDENGRVEFIFGFPRKYCLRNASRPGGCMQHGYDARFRPGDRVEVTFGGGRGRVHVEVRKTVRIRR